MSKTIGLLAWCLAACGLLMAPLSSRAAEADERPIKALFVCGGCCHDYLHQKDIITKGISERANVEWTIAYEPSDDKGKLNPIYNNHDWSKGFDVVVHDECTSDVKDLDVINNTILKPHKAGLPAVVLHCAMHSYRSEGWPQEVTPWYEFTGVRTTAHGAQLPIAITFTDKQSPITKGLSDWTTIHEELYNNEFGLLDTLQPLAHGKQTYKDKKTGREKTDDFVVVWTNVYNGHTKVFGTTIGHNNETCNDPRYLDLVTRGLLWSVGKLDESHLKPVKEASASK
jgi:type 1 glutamine amidotransferase